MSLCIYGTLQCRIPRDVSSNFRDKCYKIFVHSLQPNISSQNTMSYAFSSSQARKLPPCQPESSSKLLTSIKSLVRRPWQPSSSSRHLSPGNRPQTSCGSHARRNGPTEWDWDLAMRTTPPQYIRRESYPPPSPSNISNQQHSNPRRGRRCQDTVISMADYLTMAQLENIWQQQDTRRNNPVTAPPALRPPPTRTSAEKGALPRILQVATRPSDSSTSNSTQLTHRPPSNRDIHSALRPGQFSRHGLKINTDFSKPKSKSNKKAPVTGWEWMYE